MGSRLHRDSQGPSRSPFRSGGRLAPSPTHRKGSLAIHLASQWRLLPQGTELLGARREGRPTGNSTRDLQLKKNSLLCMQGGEGPSSLSSLPSQGWPGNFLKCLVPAVGVL